MVNILYFLLLEFVGCQPEVDSVWEITWPPTEVGDVEIQKCPGGSGVIGKSVTYSTLCTQLCICHGNSGKFYNHVHSYTQYVDAYLVLA